MAISTADRSVVNENTAAQVTVSTFDIDGSPEAAATLHYRITDVRTGTEVKELTELTPAIDTVIPLAPADNAIINATLKEEAKRVTVIANKDDVANQARGQFTYYVKNMSYA